MLLPINILIIFPALIWFIWPGDILRSFLERSCGEKTRSHLVQPWPISERELHQISGSSSSASSASGSSSSADIWLLTIGQVLQISHFMSNVGSCLQTVRGKSQVVLWARCQVEHWGKVEKWKWGPDDRGIVAKNRSMVRCWDELMPNKGFQHISAIRMHSTF